MLKMHIAKVWVVVRQDRSDVAVLLNFRHAFLMPSSTGPSFVDPSLLFPPTSLPNSTPVPPSVFYAQSTRNRPVTPPSNASIPTSTPISNKTSGNHSYASETHVRDSANYSLAQETSGLFLGAMPPQQFLNRFLPIGQDKPVFELERSFHERFERKERG
jgi:hypothetical protein